MKNIQWFRRLLAAGVMLLLVMVMAACAGSGTTNASSGQLSVSPGSINFGSVAVGSSQDQTGTLSASGSSVTVSSAAWSGQGYSVSGITFPVSVAAGKSVNYTVSFTPQAAGSASGSVSFVSDASNSPSTQTWTGTGTTNESPSPPTSYSASTSTAVIQASYVPYVGNAPDWQPSHSYAANTLIGPQPSVFVSGSSTNFGGFTYQNTGACVSGSTRPAPFDQTVGGTTSDGTCTWTNVQGSLLGAGTIVVDPDFNSNILRLTDWNTNKNYNTSCSTSACAYTNMTDDDTHRYWNTNDTLVLMKRSYGDKWLMQFNPDYFTCLPAQTCSFNGTPLYVWRDTNGNYAENHFSFSPLNPNILYQAESSSTSTCNPPTTLTGCDLSIWQNSVSTSTSPSNPPTHTTLINFLDGTHPACEPAVTTWIGDFQVSLDETTFAFATGTRQDYADWIMVYRVGSGCRMMNTVTGQVTGEWGATGTIVMPQSATGTSPDLFALHAAQVVANPEFIDYAYGSGGCATCIAVDYFWDLSDYTGGAPAGWSATCSPASPCPYSRPCLLAPGNEGNRLMCRGHNARGYIYNAIGTGTFLAEEYADPGSPGTKLGTLGIAGQHPSWENATTTDTTPFEVATSDPTTADQIPNYPTANYDEIDAGAPPASTISGNAPFVYRFNHTFNTALSWNWDTQYAIGIISQTGRFVMFSSDWNGNLGSTSNTPACDPATTCRGDVFVVQLK